MKNLLKQGLHKIAFAKEFQGSFLSRSETVEMSTCAPQKEKTEGSSKQKLGFCASPVKSWQFSNFTIHEFEELPSTNSLALELALARQLANFEIILAHTQSQGKGRLQRSWQSPLGNLYFSLLLSNPNLPQFCVKNIPQISFLAVAALGLAMENLCKKSNLAQKITINFKWPNDLLINEHKVSGVLLESKISQENCDFVVVGVGINTKFAPKIFAQENSSKPLFQAAAIADFLNKTDEDLEEKHLRTCSKSRFGELDMQDFQEPQRRCIKRYIEQRKLENAAEMAAKDRDFEQVLSNQEILCGFLSEFQKLYENWLQFGFAASRNIWLAHAFRLKQEISLNLGNESLAGIFENLDEEGNLLLKTKDGPRKITRKITFGDVGIGSGSTSSSI